MQRVACILGHEALGTRLCRQALRPEQLARAPSMTAFSVPPCSLSTRPRRSALPWIHTRSRRRASPRASATPDVVIVGAGAAGLSTAFELVQRGAAVRVVTDSERRPAGLAAAGMLAPYAEKLSPPLLRLAQESLSLYPAFINNLQAISDHDVQYVSRSDFLVPFFDHAAGDDLIRGDAVRLIEPALSDKVVAVQRHPRDASVDNRRLVRALRVACEKLGVVFDEVPVRKIIASHDAAHVAALEQQNGERLHAAHFIVAAGAWTKSLLPMVPIRPVKGQMISLVPPSTSHPLLNHVLYSSKVYIVPKNNFSEFYVGATVENCGFDHRNTPAGLKQLIDNAIELVPAMADYEVREMWAGFRPTTPDESPIFGRCTFDNLSVATGFHRNGILLAPAGAKIAAAYALDQTAHLSSELRHLVGEFTIERFYQNDVSKPAQASSTHDQSLAAGIADSTFDGGIPKSSKTAEVHIEREIKLWKVLPDGTSEPVYPPGWKGPRTPSPKRTSGNDPTGQHQPSTFLQQTPTELGPSQHSEENTSSQLTEPENPENISAVNDAYDDILNKRGPDMHDSMSKALAKNRAFGREQSSLQREDGPVLSLSEEEVQRYNAAAEMGYEDMRELEKCFDPEHESAIATRAEAEESDSKEFQPRIVVGGIEFTPPIVPGS